ncbi:MAG: alpha/beta fold hydrolase [Cyanobacteriota bacterium]|jgi:2-succinyl-6-hydroxy-2,4-cyclohexadiene-1-carboxylate synthase
MPTIDLLGVPHAYERLGREAKEGCPVLVFVHGWLLSRQYWYPLAEKLAPHYPSLLYDLRGFGDSAGTIAETAPAFGLAAYAQDLVALLTALEINQAWLVGHSLGGSIALWAASLAPEQIQGVVCLNAGGGIYLKEEFERFRGVGERLVAFRPFWLPGVPGLDWLFSRIMVEQTLERRWGRQRLRDLVRANPEAARGSLLESTTEEEVHHLPRLVSQLPQPVYFFAGQQDKVMEAKHVNYLASFHPSFYPQGQNVIELPNCGHFAMLEQLDLVAEKLGYILDSQT